MTADKPTPRSGENVTDEQSTDDDDAVATPAGIASVTSEPMPLEVLVKHDGTQAKVQLLGDGELPRRGVNVSAWLQADEARRIAMELYQVADKIEGFEDE